MVVSIRYVDLTFRTGFAVLFVRVVTAVVVSVAAPRFQDAALVAALVFVGFTTLNTYSYHIKITYLLYNLLCNFNHNFSIYIKLYIFNIYLSLLNLFNLSFNII